MKTLASFITGRDNNFNLIRFLAAGLVIVAHSYTLPGDDWSKLAVFRLVKIDPGAFAVEVFFITSGFLIGMSYLRQDSVFQYIGARVARIYPGLVVAVLFDALVMGPLFTTIPLREYFAGTSLYEFILINSTLILDKIQLRYALPAVFLANPYSSAVNGSLWTLPYEMWMYIFLMLIGLLGILGRRKWFNVFYILLILHFFLSKQFFGNFGFVQQLESYEGYATVFLTGTFFYINRDSIPMDWYMLPLVALLTVIVQNTILGPFAQLIGHAYYVLWVAFIPSGFVRNFNKLGDYSYGLYIYAFPIQQGLIASIPQISSEALLLLSTIITLLIAILSWHLIEKPALKHKGFLYQKILALAERYPKLRSFV